MRLLWMLLLARSANNVTAYVNMYQRMLNILSQAPTPVWLVKKNVDVQFEAGQVALRSAAANGHLDVVQQRIAEGLYGPTQYNYQLHQLLFEPCQQNDRTRLRYTDIAVLHFWGKVKPSNFNMKSGSPKLVTWLHDLLHESFENVLFNVSMVWNIKQCISCFELKFSVYRLNVLEIVFRFSYLNQW